jgi:hypothetical protein
MALDLLALQFKDMRGRLAHAALEGLQPSAVLPHLAGAEL